jgi:hypothetical protein
MKNSEDFYKKIKKFVLKLRRKIFLERIGKIDEFFTLVLSVKKGRGCEYIDSSSRCIVLPSPFKGGTLWVKGRKKHRPLGNYRSFEILSGR